MSYGLHRTNNRLLKRTFLHKNDRVELYDLFSGVAASRGSNGCVGARGGGGAEIESVWAEALFVSGSY